jgi:hypothetical protein
LTDIEQVRCLPVCLSHPEISSEAAAAATEPFESEPVAETSVLDIAWATGDRFDS